LTRGCDVAIHEASRVIILAPGPRVKTRSYESAEGQDVVD